MCKFFFRNAYAVLQCSIRYIENENVSFLRNTLFFCHAKMATPIDFLGTNVMAPFADILPRVTLFPFLASFWLGGQWGWALGITLLYHIAVALPLRVILTEVGVNTFPTLEILSKSDSFIQYVIGMPTMILVSALCGYLVYWALIMPKHLVPIAHFLTCCKGARKIGKHTYETQTARIEAEINYPVPDTYKIWSFVGLLLLTVLGSFVPYEVIVWMVPDGGGSILAVTMCVIPPVWSVIASLIGFYAFNLPNLFGYDEKKMYSRRVLITIAKIFAVHAVPSIGLYIVTFYRRNYHVSWLTFFCGLGLLVIGSAVHYAFFAKKINEFDVEFLPESGEPLVASADQDIPMQSRVLFTSNVNRGNGVLNI